MLPKTESEIATFIEAFETCTLPKAEWTHAAHLLTGACYVHAHGPEAAAQKMRINVSRFNESVGGKNTATSGYHETITIAWIKLLDALLRQSQPIARYAFAQRAVERFASNRNIFATYYDFDLLTSTEARLAWIEPNLTPFP